MARHPFQALRSDLDVLTLDHAAIRREMEEKAPLMTPTTRDSQPEGTLLVNR